jgi:hypothetical protein
MCPTTQALQLGRYSPPIVMMGIEASQRVDSIAKMDWGTLWCGGFLKGRGGKYSTGARRSVLTSYVWAGGAISFCFVKFICHFPLAYLCSPFFYEFFASQPIPASSAVIYSYLDWSDASGSR